MSRRRSLWPYWSIVPSLTWVSWLHAGLLTRNRRYFLFTGLYAVPFVLPLLVGEREDWIAVAGGLLIIVSWIVGLVHVFRTRWEVSAQLASAGGLAVGTAAAAPPAEPAPALEITDAPADPGFRSGFRAGVLSTKMAIDAPEDWGSATAIPIVPCIEGPDAMNEVTPKWKTLSELEKFWAVFNPLCDRRFYSLIIMFEDYFYVSQATSYVGFYRATRPHLVRRHRKDDILELVVTPNAGEVLAYSLPFAGDVVRRSSDTFRLYVRARSEAHPPHAPQRPGGTVLKYVFRVADDIGLGSSTSLQEAVDRLDQLVPAERRTSHPSSPTHRAELIKAHSRRIRNRLMAAWTWFALAGSGAMLSTWGIIAGDTPLAIRLSAMIPLAGLYAFLVILGLRSLRKRRELQSQLAQLREAQATVAG